MSKYWSPTRKRWESGSHIATIRCSSSGCAHSPGHIKNFSNPQLRSDTIVARSPSTAWSLTSCSRSFHSNILQKSCQVKTNKFQSFCIKISCGNASTRYICLHRALSTRPGVSHLALTTLWLLHFGSVAATFFGSVATRHSVTDRALSTRVAHVGTTLITRPR